MLERLAVAAVRGAAGRVVGVLLPFPFSARLPGAAAPIPAVAARSLLAVAGLVPFPERGRLRDPLRRALGRVAANFGRRLSRLCSLVEPVRALAATPRCRGYTGCA